MKGEIKFDGVIKGKRTEVVNITVILRIFKTTPFTLTISVTDALFGTTVILEKKRKFGEFTVLLKEFT